MALTAVGEGRGVLREEDQRFWCLNSHRFGRDKIPKSDVRVEIEVGNCRIVSLNVCNLSL